jgi:hypothetical protein
LRPLISSTKRERMPGGRTADSSELIGQSLEV